MTIGERIKQRRQELNITQQELALMLGYKDRSAVCQVEKDKNNSITTERVAAFAKALNCRPADLMGWDIDSDDHDPQEVEKALELYEQYQHAIPEVQKSVEILLKSSRSET